MRYAFDRFTLDTQRCVLTRDGVRVPIRPKVCDLLEHLVRRAGTVALKDDLLAEVWPGVTVAEDSLTQAVAALRLALGPDGARLIRTVPRRGYLLEAAVVRLPAEQPMGIGTRPTARFRTASVLGFAGLAVVGLLAGSTAPVALPNAGQVLDTTTTAIGQPIDYPIGAARLVASVKILPAGTGSGWHAHPVPLFAYVLAGEVVLDYGERGTQRYREGTAIVEAIDWPHQARNEGRSTARILVVELRSATPTGDIGPVADVPAAPPRQSGP